MRIELKLDNSQFDEFGMGEAHFTFKDLRDLEVEDYNLSFRVWGLDARSEFIANLFKVHNLDFEPFVGEDIYIAGFTTLHFSNPKLLMCNGLSLRLEQNQNEPFYFTLGGVINKRFNEFTLLADKHVTLSFDTDDFITVKEYVRNPHRYSYKG